MLNNFSAGAVAAAIALAPQAITGSADVNGAEIDLHAFGGGGGGRWQRGKFVLQTGAKGGTVAPTSLTLTFRVQHTDTSGSGYADVTDTQIAEAAVQLTDQNKVGELNLNLSGLKQYLRIVGLPAFTGGTAPSVLAAATFIAAEPRVI